MPTSPFKGFDIALIELKYASAELASEKIVASQTGTGSGREKDSFALRSAEIAIDLAIELVLELSESLDEDDVSGERLQFETTNSE